MIYTIALLAATAAWIAYAIYLRLKIHRLEFFNAFLRRQIEDDCAVRGLSVTFESSWWHCGMEVRKIGQAEVDLENTRIKGAE